MTALFNYRDDSADPLLVELGKLREVFGVEPEHMLADPSAPMVISIGSGKYVSNKDFRWLLHLRAEAALARRMGRGAEEDLAETYPSLAASLKEFKQEVARYAARATAEPAPVAGEDRFYQPEPAPAAAVPEPAIT
jgi:hypothetical protein